MNIYEPNFSSSQVAEAAGMTHSNFRAHLARGNWAIVGGSTGGAAAGGAGKGHLFTIYDALGYALAAELLRHGVDPQQAYKRAMFDFAHAGGEEWDGASGYAMRDPGGVFDTAKYGRTVFAYSRDAERGQCIPLNTLAHPSNLFFTRERKHVRSLLLIDLNDLRDRTFHALGLDARDYE